MLHIYELKRYGAADFDECAGMIVAADSEPAARDLAAQYAADEGAAVWRNEDRASCKCLGTASPHTRAGVILRDVNWG